MTRKIFSFFIAILFLTPILIFSLDSSPVFATPHPSESFLNDVGTRAFGTPAPANPQAAFIQIVARIINVSLSLLGIIFLVLILLGGFKWMTAGGETDKIKKAQDTIKNAAIGLIIVLSAWAITRFVVEAIVSSTTATTRGR